MGALAAEGLRGAMLRLYDAGVYDGKGASPERLALYLGTDVEEVNSALLFLLDKGEAWVDDGGCWTIAVIDKRARIRAIRQAAGRAGGYKKSSNNGKQNPSKILAKSSGKTLENPKKPIKELAFKPLLLNNLVSQLPERNKEEEAFKYIGHPSKIESKTDAQQSTAGEAEPADQFERLWKLYPRRIGKEDARRHFKAQIKKRADLVALEGAVANYARELELLGRGADPTFILHGKTFFNRGWLDYRPGIWKEPKKGGTSGTGTRGTGEQWTSNPEQQRRKEAALQKVRGATGIGAALRLPAVRPEGGSVPDGTPEGNSGPGTGGGSKA